ncbi:MAG: PBP1A family penicillin-binding protein [bacterium]
MAKRKISSEDMERYFNDPEYRRSFLKRSKGFIRRFWKWFLAAGTIMLGLSVWYGFYVAGGLPSLERLENPASELDLASKVYSSDNVVIHLYHRGQNRTPVPLDSIPPYLIQALISTEDKDFFDHWGVNSSRFIRQMVLNVLTLRKAGASTITQQLARSLYNLKERNENLFALLTRKIRELITSVQIERNFTKREILELYLNVVWYGGSTYGIETAASRFFDKPVKNLTLGESTFLVGILPNPGLYNPLRNPEGAFNRRSIVLSQLVKDGHLTSTEAEQVRKDSLIFKMHEQEMLGGIAPHFVESIRQQLEQKQEQYGFDLYTGGLKIYTTLDSRLQRYANRAVEEHLAGHQQQFDKSWKWERHVDILQENVDKMIRDLDAYKKLKGDSRDSLVRALRANPAFVDSVKKAAQMIECGFVCIDPHTGYIKAMVGGQSKFRFGLNHVTQIHRQPGSAFKAFLYTAALDNGTPPCYEVVNQPVTVAMVDGTEWSPRNFEEEFGGMFTLREALKRSINLVAVRLIVNDIVPAKQVVEYAHRMGIKSPIPPYESIALGSAEVTPLEITAAYGVFPNEGVYVEPISILKIEDKDGNVLEENIPEKREALSKETAYLMTDLLEGVVNELHGTGLGIRSYFFLPAAGKTGTTDDYGDAWFIGFTPQLVAGIWVGFDDHRIKFSGSDGQGGRAAAPIFGRFMRATYEDPSIGLQLEYFKQPDGIVTDTICVESKKKATEFCPKDTTEIFNIKYLPGPCDIHTTRNWKDSKERTKINW